MAKDVRGHPTGQIELLQQPTQQRFIAALQQKTPSGRNAFHRLSLFSGRRGGKTRIGAVGVAVKMQQPNSIGWVTAPSYPDLHDYVIPTVLATIPHAWIGNWSEQHLELELKNYAKAQFRSLDDPDKARGPGLDWAWIDETRKVAQRAWKTMLPALTDKGGQAWFTTSPNGFDWCYKDFWLPAQEGIPGYWAAKYRTADNPKFQTLEGRQELADAKRSMDPLFYQQEFEADFVTFTGAVYGASIAPQILRTDDEIRTVLPDWPQIDPSLECYVGLDPGADHPFAGVVALMTKKGLVFVGEWLERNRTVRQHVDGLTAILEQWNRSRPFQPAVWAIDRSQKQTSIELAHEGVYATAAENSVENGIRRIQAWLARRQMWFIEPLVPRTIEHLQGLRWAENTRPDGQALKERVIKELDDLPDAARYLVMAGPSLPEIEIAPSGGRRSIEDIPEEARWQVERMQRCEQPKTDDSAFAQSADDGPPGLADLGFDPNHPASHFWM